MAEIQSRSYESLSGTLFNATTSAINFGTAPMGVAAQSCLALIFPKGSGQNGFGWVWSRASGTGDGQRFVVDHNSGSPRLQVVCSCSGSSGGFPWIFTGGNTVVYNKWNHIGFWWDGTTSSVSGIDAFSSQNGAPLAALTATYTNGSGSATNSAANNFLIGNSSNTARTFNGVIAYVARWNRVLRQAELIVAQKFGPLAVPEGLIMCWANNRDYGPYRLKPTSKTALAIGQAPPSSVTRGLMVPYRRIPVGTGAVPGRASGWFLGA